MAEPGLIQAGEGLNRLRLTNAQLQEMQQALAVQQWQQKMREQQQRELEQDRKNFGEALARQMPMDKSAQGQIPQPPMPGQSSQPMMPPMPPGQSAATMFGNAMGGPPPAAPTQPPPTPPPMPQGPPPGPAMRPATVNLAGVTPEQGQAMLQTIQANRTPMPGAAPGAPGAAPQGWQPSPAATPAVGGQPPAPGGAPPGGAAPGGIPLPPTPQMPMPRQGQGFSVMGTFQKMVDSGVPAGDAIRAIENNMPVIQAENREQLESLRAENAAVNAAFKAYQAEINAFRARTDASNKESLIATRKARVDAALAKEGQPGTVTSYPPEVIDYYARRTAQGDNSWRVGLSRNRHGSDLILQVDQRVPTLQAERGVSAEQAGAQTQSFKSDSAALAQITKDITGIKPFADMLDTNASILKDMAKKVIASDSRLANQPILWLEQNLAGDPDVAEYLAQIRIVQTEAARVLNNPRLVGQLTDTARHEMEDVFSGNMSLSATTRVIDRLLQDSVNRVGKMEKQRDELMKRMGKPPGAAPATSAATASLPPTNAKGWKLMHDKDGNVGYVSPDGKQVEEVTQ